MPRPLVLLAALLIGGASAAAQTQAEARFGLAVGNVWEYELRDGDPWTDTTVVVGHERWAIVRDTVVAGSGERGWVLVGGEAGEAPGTCALVARAPSQPFGNHDFQLAVVGGCTFRRFANTGQFYREEPRFVADVGHERCIPLGAPHGDRQGLAAVCGRGGEFGNEMGYPIGDAYVRRTHVSAALDGVGVVQAYVWRDSTAASGDRVVEAHGRYLTHARVFGVEYGAARAVAAAEGPAPSATRLRVGPNPAREATTVWVETAGALAVLDLLGREVRRVEVARPGPVRLDLGGLPPGPYAVRQTTADGLRQARIVVVR